MRSPFDIYESRCQTSRNCLMKTPNRFGHAAFTLIELLVVIAIIGILASLILPSLGRTKQHSKVAVCLNNLHQIDLGIEMFVQDNGGRYPGGLGGPQMAREFVCRDMSDDSIVKEMLSRPLYPYIKPSKVYACPEDKGEDFSPDSVNYQPSIYYAFGCSYSFNTTAWKYTKHVPEAGLAGATPSWVREPNRYIMVYEQPARPVWKIVEDLCSEHTVESRYYFHWHFGNRKSPTIMEDQLAGDPLRFISPILFVDGHAAKHDFTDALKAEPKYPLEETKDWMWYQFKPEPQKQIAGLGVNQP
jgi:prepilin-type N-terminal cleavage/methylation domain-containing protein